MSIVNMMILVPMLIETFSFGFIYDHFLHIPTYALEFSAVLFAIAAIAMTWIRPPKKQSPVISLTYRQIMGLRSHPGRHRWVPVLNVGRGARRAGRVRVRGRSG